VLAPDPDRARLARDAARADLARFVAACYYQPEAAFGEERLFEHIEQASRLLDDELTAIAARLRAGWEGAALEELLVDYTRLFLGPVEPRARPYASVWLSGENQVMQASTLDVARLYEEAGFGIAPDFPELPDHVAVELEFLYLLLFRAQEARTSGDDAALARWLELRRRFLDGHAGRWLGPFLLAMHEGAETPFYEALAELTERVVRLARQDADEPAATGG
jgi:TorA maturation chaperone TorD